MAHYREAEGYSQNWFNTIDDYGHEEFFRVALPDDAKGDLYFTTETYFFNIVPAEDHCQGNDYPSTVKHLVVDTLHIYTDMTPT